MDGYEATRTVFSRIQNLDPENASKIMGFLLIQDHGEKEMIRLAFGPESLLQSLITRAKTELGISSNISSTPSSPSPFLYHPSLSRQNSSSFPSSASSNSTNISTSSTGISTNTSRVLSKLVLPNPNFSSSSWAAAPSTFSDLHNPNDLLISPNSSSSLSYAASINAFNNQNNYGMTSLGSSSSDLIDEIQLQDQLSFLNEKNSDFLYPSLEQVSSPNSYGPNWRGSNNPSLSNGSHRRSCSVSDINLDSDPRDTGLEWKPCLYYARGFCKNGPTCRFNHGFTDSPDSPSLVGSPANFDVMEQCQELLRSQTQQQQQQMRMNTASQLLASGSLPYTSAAGKYMNFLLQQQQNDNQRAAAEALLLGEDMHRIRMERNGFSNSGGWMTDPGSRQIYLTFPADSTFREEDVSNYFSIYGPVQDVRIPYQQKRMFGFVTFLYPETVKMILAKGNPHFVGDARVLVKPYKEKAKVLDKKQQQGERGEFSPCTTPTGIDSRDPYNQQLGTRMLYENQDLLLRRKMEEQVELQQAIDLHSRRLMGLQLMDIKKHHHHRNLSMGALPPSPTQLHAFMNQAMRHPLSSPRTFESGEESHRNPAVIISTPVNQQTQHVADNVNANNGESVCDDNGKEERSNGDCEFHDRSTSGNEAIDI